MSKHSPLPWRKEGICLDCTPVSICDSSGVGLADVYDAPDPNTKHANAEFIVKAVNNHDAILEVLDNATAALETMLIHYETHNTKGDLVGRWRVLNDARQAMFNAGFRRL